YPYTPSVVRYQTAPQPVTPCNSTAWLRARTNQPRQWALLRVNWGFRDDDAVRVRVHVLARVELHATEAQHNILLASTGLCGLARVGAQRLAAEVHLADGLAVADRGVDDHARPAVLLAQAGDDVAHQCGVQGLLAIDDQHAARVRLAEDGLQQRIVLEAGHRGDAATELDLAAEVLELRVAGPGLRSDDVNQVCRGDKSDLVHSL